MYFSLLEFTANACAVAVLIVVMVILATIDEIGNGANFSLVPHVHPQANGLVSGLTGAAGNLGGVIFSIIFRFAGGGSDYATSLWIIGIITLALNLCLAWLPPLPRGQIGGH